ncbi:hypothetical protein PAMP_014510 [Pampus punctatissimus]
MTPDSISSPEIINLRLEWDLIAHLIRPGARYCSYRATENQSDLIQAGVLGAPILTSRLPGEVEEVEHSEQYRQSSPNNSNSCYLENYRKDIYAKGKKITENNGTENGPTISTSQFTADSTQQSCTAGRKTITMQLSFAFRKGVLLVFFPPEKAELVSFDGYRGNMRITESQELFLIIYPSSPRKQYVINQSWTRHCTFDSFLIH